MPLGIDWLVSSGSASSRSSLILWKALYGLKQAPRLWYEHIDKYLQSIGFWQSAEGPNLYLQQGILLVLYMDPLLIAHNGAEGRGHRIKQLLQKKYKMCELGAAKRFREIEIERTKDGEFSICQHQEKKCASGRTGCVLTHQALGTLWTHPGSAHNAPNAKRTGNVNSDAARHGTMCPDAARHDICLPDGAWQGIFVLDARCQGIFVLDARCQGIFLLDAAVSGHFPSGRSRVRAFSFWTQPCQGIFLLDAAVSGHFPSGCSRVRANGIQTTRVMGPLLRWLSRHGTSQQILASHSQTHSGFQA